VAGSLKDGQGRLWDIAIDVISVDDVRKTNNLNLLELVAPQRAKTELVERLNDPVLLVEVLWTLCKEQGDTRKIGYRDFARAMTADAIEAAWLVIQEQLVLFSRPGIRPALQKVMEKAQAKMQAIDKRVVEMVDDPSFDAELEKELTRPRESGPTGSLTAAGSLPDSSASGPHEATPTEA